MLTVWRVAHLQKSTGPWSTFEDGIFRYRTLARAAMAGSGIDPVTRLWGLLLGCRVRLDDAS